jgi:hypothetical protein
MPEFNRGHGQIDAAGMDATRATARLPGLDIEIVHRRPVEDDAEQIYINLRAALSLISERRCRSRPSAVRSKPPIRRRSGRRSHSSPSSPGWWPRAH